METGRGDKRLGRGRRQAEPLCCAFKTDRIMDTGFFLLLLGVCMVTHGRHLSPQDSPGDAGDVRVETPPSNFVGESTNELATTLLQGFVEQERDFAFSPLGYSVILALMAEGAGGQTRNQLVTALHLPEDILAIRDNYKAILSDMSEKWAMNKPEFKNWFYVYKNYTVNDSYKKILLDNYFTAVKYVDRVHYEVNFEAEEDKEKEKDKIDEKEDETAEHGEKKEEETVEPEEKLKTKIESDDSKQEENISKSSEEEKVEKEEEHPLLSKYDGSKEVASALTANSIVQRTSQDLDPETKMIVFNGFYFRGNWKTPFMLVKEDEKRSFYKSVSEKKLVTMLQTKGNFDMGPIPELDACALELPYEGEKYSMLVLLPNQRDGLNKLIADITGFSLNKVYKYLVDRPVEVLLPKYQIQTISHPEKILQKYGVSDLFTDEADLSGISPDKLRMGALVQLVNIQVDEGSSDTNFLTTTLTAGAMRNNVEKFVADHPFLFFIRDHTKNIIVAAGKVLDPKFETSDDLAP